MERVGAFEAKTHLPALLRRVERGEKITITKHGVPVAVLQPFAETGPVDIDKAVLEIKRLRKKNSLRGLSLRDLIAEGRK